MINIVLLIFLIFILMFNLETFVVAYGPDYYKKLEYNKLQKQITSNHDNHNTKVKKMAKHFLDQIKNTINNTGSFLNVVNMNNKDSNGCILFRSMSADFTQKMIEIKLGDGTTIKNTIINSINQFVEDYEFLLYKYYNIPKNTIYKTELPPIDETNKSNNISIKKYYLKNLKDILETAYPKFDNADLVLYDGGLIKDSLLNELNKFNFKDLPTKLIEMLQELDMNQCTANKLCCA